MTEIDIAVEHPAWESTCPGYEAVVHRAIGLVLDKAPVAQDLLARGMIPEISVVLTDDNSVQALNRDYRGKDKPTNVLSFALLDSDDGWTAPDHPGPCPLGDLVLAYETVEREATDENKPFESHFTHLLIHGLLHLLGYDHIDDAAAETMESLEIQLLSSINIKNPYQTA